jgi:phospholipid/cholesterol/gamma-HCH transport system substrate-binding protein
MKSVKTNRPVIVGLFIIIGLVIIIIGVFSLGKQKKTFVKGFTLNTVFDDVSGLQSGNNVWLSGVKVGTVKRLSFLPNSRVLVSMVIQKSLEPIIRKDSRTKISSDGLIGNKIIVIFGGSSSTAEVANGDFLTAQKALSTEDMLVTLQANNKNLLAITGSFRSIGQKIDSGNGALGTLLNNKVMANKIGSSINSLEATMSNFEDASFKSKAVLANLQAFTDKINSKGSSINELATDTTLFKELKSSVTQLSNAAASASQIAANLDSASSALHEKNNAVGVLLNDEETAESIKQTIKNLESSSKKLDEDLEAAQHNFLLKGYFKKKGHQPQDSLNSNK